MQQGHHVQFEGKFHPGGWFVAPWILSSISESKAYAECMHNHMLIAVQHGYFHATSYLLRRVHLKSLQVSFDRQVTIKSKKLSG